MQGIVTARKKFIDVCVGEPGSIHDARVLRRSNIYLKAQDPNFFGQYFLIGDSAYPNLNWLVVPFRDNGRLTEQQIEFNYKLSATRIVVEHTYGLLKGRFRRLLHITNSDLSTCNKVVMAASVLHNICIAQNDVIPLDNENMVIENQELEEAPQDFQFELNVRNRIFQEMFD